MNITDGALGTLIRSYCRESGVRNLQKQIEKVCAERPDADQLGRHGLRAVRVYNYWYCMRYVSRANFRKLCFDFYPSYYHFA